MQPSRRAFLLGRRSLTPWQQFCQALAAWGRLHRLDEHTARFAPPSAASVQQVCQLAATHGVRLAQAGISQAGISQAVTAAAQALLWLDPAPALTVLTPLASGPWRAEAGVRVADLQAVGLPQFADIPEAAAQMTLAAWLAGPAARLCATGNTAAAGVLGLEVVLADGTQASLGEFGEHAAAPLCGATVQRLIPRLFELAHSAQAHTCSLCPHWPARVRLDALRGKAINLAHLLLGQGGSLAWVHAAVLAAPPVRLPESSAETLFQAGTPGVPDAQPATPEQGGAAHWLDEAARQLFDPAGRFL